MTVDTEEVRWGLEDIREEISRIEFGTSYRMFNILYERLAECINTQPFEAAELLDAMIRLSDIEHRYQLEHHLILLWRNYTPRVEFF